MVDTRTLEEPRKYRWPLSVRILAVAVLGITIAGVYLSVYPV